MKFYEEELNELLQDNNTLSNENIHYHKWSNESIAKFWSMHSNSLINKQFYPISYWENLIDFVILKTKSQPKTIVNIGTGNGNMEEILLKKFPSSKIIGIDLSDDSLTFARNRFKENDRISFRVGNATYLPLDDISGIDMIIMTEVLEHLFMDDFIKTFGVVSSKLVLDGYFIATCPFKETISFVACPECGCTYQANQHMIMDINPADIENLCSNNNMRVLNYYQGINRTIPPISKIKQISKLIMLKILPDDILSKIFPFNGATGFIARKI